MTTTFTREEIVEMLSVQYVGDQSGEAVTDALELIDMWTERGDGCAVYRNEEIGHPGMGNLKFVSFGGTNAQIPVPNPQGNPPDRLPDIGTDINWRYVLVGTYRIPRRY